MSKDTYHHLVQQDDVSCGPACVQIVAASLLARDGRRTTLTQYQVRHMMGTDGRVGTTEVQMTRGLAAYGIASGRRAPLDGAVDRVGAVEDCVRDGDLVLIRAMKDGYRHWLVAAGMASRDRFVILDPEEPGPVAWHRSQLAAAMAPRGFEFWQIPALSPCRALGLGPVGQSETDIDRSIGLAAKAFAAHVPEDFDFKSYLYPQVDWGLSVALRDGGELLGAYLLAERSPAEALEDEGLDPALATPVEEAFAGMHGVEGIALVVREELLGLGYGRLLRAMPGELGYDYAHGLQLASLENIDDWRKVRQVVNLVSDGMWQSAGKTEPLRPMMIADVSTAMDAEYPVAGPRM